MVVPELLKEYCDVLRCNGFIYSNMDVSSSGFRSSKNTLDDYRKRTQILEETTRLFLTPQRVIRSRMFIKGLVKIDKTF